MRKTNVLRERKVKSLRFENSKMRRKEKVGEEKSEMDD